MKLHIQKLTQERAEEMCQWHYQEEYAVYDLPSWELMVEQNWGITDEAKREKEFFGVVSEKEDFIGFFRLVEQEESIHVGLGLHPDFCGKKIGNEFMELIKQVAFEKYPHKKLSLEVRVFNERAIKCYEKSGFCVKDTYYKDSIVGGSHFVLMECEDGPC